MDADLIERAADVARDSRNLDGETVIIGELIDRIKVLESDDHEWYLQADRIEKLEAALDVVDYALTNIWAIDRGKLKLAIADALAEVTDDE